MTKKTKLAVIIAASILAIVVIVIALSTVFGSQKLPVDSTVKVEFDGADGYGTANIVSARDWQETIKFKKNQNNTPLESMGYMMILEQCIDYSLSKDEELSNGDTVELKITVDKEVLKQYGFKAKDVTKKIKVTGLKKVKEINPFKEGNVKLETHGISGAGSLSSFNDCIQIKLENGEMLELDLDLMNEEELDGKLANGDKVSVKIADDYSDAELANSYGIVFTKREADIVVKNMNYYPTENPREIFEYLGEEDMKNVLTAVQSEYQSLTKLMSKYNIGEVKAEYVGAVYYYTDPINFENSRYDDNNQLALIYHVTNGVEPDGWYAYMAPTEGVYIESRETEDGSLVKVTTMGNKSSKFDVFPDTHGNYSTGPTRTWMQLEIPISFEYEGLTYMGYQSLEECIKAFVHYKITNDTNLYGQIIEKSYNHVVVTENLKEYVEEY